MKCDEVQPLQGSYLDSELDARTTLEVQEHLKSCQECARLFVEEQRFDAWMTSGLKQGQRSASLWEVVERAVAQPARVPKPQQSSPGSALHDQWTGLIAALAAQLRVVCRQTPRAWSGIAVAWLLILFLNLETRDSETTPVARAEAPSTSEMRFALKQKQLLVAELSIAAETSSPVKVKTPMPRPRSQRQESNLKT